MNINFLNEEHRHFYTEMLEKTEQVGDVYHEALFYALGLTAETRRNIGSLYDFENAEIIFSGIHKGFQTGTSSRITQLAFNLFNGYYGKQTDEHPSEYTPYELFACELLPFMLEAVKLRYKEYWR